MTNVTTEDRVNTQENGFQKKGRTTTKSATKEPKRMKTPKKSNNTQPLDSTERTPTERTPTERTDEELLFAHREDPTAGNLALLIKRYERELYNYLRRYLGDAAMAEDAFQTTFLQVHMKSHLFDTKRRFRPWLYTVATNQAIDIQRRNKRHQLVSLDRPNRSEHAEVGTLMDLLASGESSAAERFDARERMEWVRRAVAALPETLESAVSLVYFRGLKYREAADELSVPVGTVKSRLHSAIGQLGQAWRDSEQTR